jgi:tetratricopeptide (TPR) repeat protein
VSVLLATPAAVHGEPEPQGPITVTLPSGTVLPPGHYAVEINTANGVVSADVAVAGPPASQSAAAGQSTQASVPGSPVSAPTAEGQPPAASEGQSDGDVWVYLFAVLAAGLLLIGGYAGYTRLLVPRRHIREYWSAVDLIQRGEYRKALPALSRVEHRLPENLRSQAGFFAAFALFRLDSLDEAEHRLAVLHREDPQDVDIAYLLAYLRMTRQDYDGAEPVLEAVDGAGGMNRRPARLLYGVVEFHRALEALRAGRVDAAAMLFQKVERLGDFADRVPADLRNQHVVLGAQALFDRDLVTARGQFEDLTRAALEDAEADQREPMLASADIGLALAAWLENTSTSMILVDPLLANAANRLDPTAATEMTWTFVPEEGSVVERLAALTRRQDRTADLNETDLALRSIHLLRAAAVLRLWAAEGRSAADGERLAEVLSRLACARERDPEYGDPYLIAGLLRCYLATTERERADGVALLRHAQQLGVREPDLVRILNEASRRGRERRDATDRYLQVLDQYVADPSVRQEVRASLLERLSRYSKVRSLDRRPELARARVVSPTVNEMNSRSELLRERVKQFMAAESGNENVIAALRLAQNLEYDSRTLAEQAHSVETKEADLLVLIGDWLLGDNEG